MTTARTSRPRSPFGRSRGLRWLVLLVLVVGAVLTAMGQVKSHGLAELAVVQPVAHSHEDAADHHPPGDINTAADHAHHGADHSHDNAHSTPHAWRSIAAQPASWASAPRRWVELVEAFRLERPPMV